VSLADATARRYARLKSLFLGTPAEQGTTSLRRSLRARGAATRTLLEVLALLGGERRPAHRGLTAAIAEAADGALPLRPSQDPPPRGMRMGVWTITGELGQGGMGWVMAAERNDGLYRQRGAIKLLRGRPDREALARLSRERQILAGLQHVHIARLLDGGTTPEGRPYLVMEHIDGERIDLWCRRHGLGLDATLERVDQVCAALTHAHRQLVVHCDIKPSNVLVDRDGCVRLLDFGIARLQDDSRAWLPAMTPAYASPEQLAGEPPGVPSDLFSLGRLVQELVRPLGMSRWRRTQLDAILAKATAAAPDARYPDVSSFSADLHRFRRGQPVEALTTPGWQGRRYLLASRWRRQGAWWIAGAAVVAMGVGFTLRVIGERDRARAAEARATAARDRADREAAVATRVTDFAIGLFEGADSRRDARAADTPARELLARGRRRLAMLEGQPELQIRLLDVLGSVYENLGHSDIAAEVYEQGLALATRLAQPDRASEDGLLYKLAFTANRQGRYTRALACAQALLAHRTSAGANEADRADAFNAMGVVLTNLGRLDEAATNLETARRLRLHAFGPQGEPVTQVETNLALLALARHRWDEAERRVALAQRLDADGGHPVPSAYRRFMILALAAERRGDNERAERLYGQAADEARLRYGRDGAPLHRVLRELGRLQDATGRPAEADRTLARALEAARGGGDDRNPFYAVTMAWHARALAHLGRLAASRSALMQARAAVASGGTLEPWADAEIARCADGRSAARAADPRAALISPR